MSTRKRGKVEKKRNLHSSERNCMVDLNFNRATSDSDKNTSFSNPNIGTKYYNWTILYGKIVLKVTRIFSISNNMQIYSFSL